MPTPLAVSRILVTQAAAVMKPAPCRAPAEQGTEVIEGTAALTVPGALDDAVGGAQRIDARFANLAVKSPTALAVDLRLAAPLER